VAELPAVTLAHCIPLKAGTDIVLAANYAISDDRVASLPPCVKNIPPAFGKVGYCCTAIETSACSSASAGLRARYFIIGGEDGLLKAYRHADVPSVERAGGLQIVQELVMRGFVPARAVATCRSSCGDKGILVACGGKLTYSIWTYDFSVDAPVPPLDHYFRLQVNGASTWTKATQDHRLLTASCAASDTLSSSDDTYVVVLGDSRGVATVLAYSHSVCTQVDEFECSEFPLLVSTISKLPATGEENVLSLFACFGDSDGTIYFHLLTICLTTKKLLSNVLVGTYEAHDMGVNCITSGSPVSVADCHGTNGVMVAVASGGDDQALCVASVQLVWRGCWCAHSISVVRRTGASGSALKGVDFVAQVIGATGKGQWAVPLVAVGYDRRLLLWAVSFNTIGEPSFVVGAVPFALSYDSIASAGGEGGGGGGCDDPPIRVSWRGGAPVHVSDIGGCCVAAASSDSTDAFVGVVGEGLQVFTCRSTC
jgi:hypothetical protein